MPHYVAIVEDSGPDKAVGLWFPDLPGCFSAGDTVDEALLNAGEAVLLYAESLAKEGRHTLLNSYRGVRAGCSASVSATT